MNKKGFTLVEVLGVMVIIVTLSLIILPNIINRFSNKKEDISSANKEILVSAAKIYVSDKKEELKDYSVYCVDITKLVENDYIADNKDVFNSNSDYAANHSVKVTIGKPNEYEVVESSSCKNVTPYDTGNKIKVAGIDFYIISNHDDYVVALKAEPLTEEEINTYGIANGVNHVNRYTGSYIGKAVNTYSQSHGWIISDDNPKYGGMAYYSSQTCGYSIEGDWGSINTTECSTDYKQSDVKIVVDNWTKNEIDNDNLKEEKGYKSRLVEKEELRMQFYPSCSESARYCFNESTTPSWVYAPNYEYWYWTMSQYNDSSSGVWGVQKDLLYGEHSVCFLFGAVRPVINVYKSAIDEISAQ